MINRNKLRGKIVENGFSVEELSKQIGINPSTFYRKMDKDSMSQFTIGECHKMCSILNLSSEDAISIFLPEYSHKCENGMEVKHEGI